MDGTTALALIAGIWAVNGLLLGYSMRRRGHDFWAWFALGATIGPLAVPAAIARTRQVEFHASPTADLVGVGGFDVLAGIDGSEESEAAVDEALTLFGPGLTSLTLAMVLDYESAGRSGEAGRAEAQRKLSDAAEHRDFRPIQTVLLYGEPAEAIIEFARSEGMELVVVGARGRGLSQALFGSVTARLVGGCDVPVFVGPRTRAMTSASPRTAEGVRA